MLLRRGSLLGGLTLALTLFALPSSDAHACGGGFFTKPSETESTSMTGHRVAISISTTQTVLWDQIHYEGNPSEFAWILPVKKGAFVEVGSDAWLEALDAGTTPAVHSPVLDCATEGDGPSGIGCGSAPMNDKSGGFLGGGGGSKETVEVLHRGTVGPYESVTLTTDAAGVLDTWLTDHGFAIPSGAAPILDDYVAQDYDFIAVRLQPGASVKDMKPLRVVTPGPITTFPLRMLSVGAKDKIALKLFVITEGRASVKNFPNAEIHGDELTWDFAESRSTYADVRASKTAAAGADTPWLTSYALNDFFLTPREGHAVDFPNGSVTTIADAYFNRANQNGEIGLPCGASAFAEIVAKNDKITPLCTPNGPECVAPKAGEVSAENFRCDTLTDLAVAVTGMHARDVWLTRLEAELPVAALAKDLELVPGVMNSSAAGEVDNHLFLAKATNVDPACTAVSADSSGSTAELDPSARSPQRSSSRSALGATLFAAFGLGLGRRASRRRDKKLTGRR